MGQLALITFWVASALYVGATVLYGYHFLSKRKTYSWYARFLTGAGFLAHTASIGLQWAFDGRFPLTGAYASLSLAAWALILIYFVVEHMLQVRVYGVLLVPLAVIGMATAQLNASRAVNLPPQAEGYLDSWRVAIHVALIMIANAGFLIAAAASVLYLLQEGQLKAHRTSALFRRLPSLAQTDMLARRLVSFAFPLYSAGVLLGTIRAIEKDVTGWWADPRVMLAGVVLGIFGAYLVLHYRSDISGRSAAWIAISGAGFVILLSVLARTLPAGFHIFGL